MITEIPQEDVPDLHVLKREDIDFALKITSDDRDLYRLASWLSAFYGQWDVYMMADLKAYLGIATHQVDDEVASGIGSLLADGRMPRRGPRFTKQDRQQQQIKAELLQSEGRTSG